MSEHWHLDRPRKSCADPYLLTLTFLVVPGAFTTITKLIRNVQEMFRKWFFKFRRGFGVNAEKEAGSKRGLGKRTMGRLARLAKFSGNMAQVVCMYMYAYTVYHMVCISLV